jgi:NAD+ kinase
MKYKKIAIIAGNIHKTRDKLAAINKKYNFIQIENIKEKPDANLIIILGGDGFMLHCLHSLMHFNIPIYGINCGTVGFLLNPFDLDNLNKKLDEASISVTHPLEMTAKLTNGNLVSHLAVNEVSLFRRTSQSSKIMITVDNEIRLNELVCDGILLATPAGSSAYNYSVHGPILPIGSNILALTPISPFRPRKWSGAILPSTAVLKLTVLDPQNRPVNAVADFLSVDSVESVTIRERKDIAMNLLFDPNHSLEERIMKEQFAY